jgi:PfaD family protein
MLAETQQADVVMAPAADMFEMGVKVQVLKRGTMFAMRAAKLYEIYRQYNCLEDLPSETKQELEKKIFRYPLETVWEQTYNYFLARDVTQIERANRDSRYKMALVFRWYLGQSSRWPMTGDPSRRIDYQIWCGPAMGAFNEWVRESFLEDPQQRQVGIVALNILHGASVATRTNLLRSQGIQIPPEFINPAPLSRRELEQYL